MTTLWTLAFRRRAYEDGGYQNRIDYRSPPAIPLRRPDQEWADEFLKAKRPK